MVNLQDWRNRVMDWLLLLGVGVGLTPVVRFALRRGANPDAMYSSTMPGRAEDEDGAPVGGVTRGGPTPCLMVAVGNPHIAVLLIAAGANVNCKMDRGFTALHQAAARSTESVVRMLLEAGAIADARMDDGTTPRDLAALYDCPEIVRLLDEWAAKPSEVS